MSENNEADTLDEAEREQVEAVEAAAAAEDQAAAAAELAAALGVDDTAGPEPGPARPSGPEAAPEVAVTWEELAEELAPVVAGELAPNWSGELTRISLAWARVLDKRFPGAASAGRFREEIAALFVTVACVRAMRETPPRGPVHPPIDGDTGGQSAERPAPPPPDTPSDPEATVGSIQGGADQ